MLNKIGPEQVVLKKKIPSMDKIKLTTGPLSDKLSLNETLKKRGSCRNFSDKPIFMNQLASILWSGQGVLTRNYDMRRTTPSAGSTFPLELMVAVRKDGVEDLAQGIYHYLPDKHTLKKISEKDISEDISAACFNQEYLKKAPVSLLVASEETRTTRMYAERGQRYVYMESGAAMQNISLEAVEMGLGTVIVGAFDDAAVKELFELEEVKPLAIMPVGYPKDKAFYA